jgi:sugar/nucleoside kinase (ribokinase family)
MRYDYTSIGFITYDCLMRPYTQVPPGGGTVFIPELTLAVSGAAGSAVVAAAKYGLKALAVGGVGKDDMGDWVLMKLASFGIDTSTMQRSTRMGTSSSIVLTRADGSRPALHMKGATADFEVTDAMLDQVLDAQVVHIGGTGLMTRMDGAPSVKLLAEAKRRGCTTTLDVFAATQDDLKLVAGLLPHTDYFMPSIEEAQALSGLTDVEDTAKFFLDQGVTACVLTLGGDGAYYRHRDGAQFLMPPFQVDVVCTCGCGDVFNAGMATGIVKGLDPETMVRLAQATSALNATGLGSQAGVKSYEHTLEFMRTQATRPSTVRLRG